MTVGTVRSASRDGPSDTQERAGSRHEEAAWVTGLRDGDESAFANVFRAHVAPLVRHARRFVLSDAAAQDIVMDVFLHLWRDRHTLPADVRLGAYLNVAVRNAALNAVAHGRVEASSRERSVAEGWSPAMGTAPLAPDEALERAEAKESLRRAYLTLPAPLQRIIELRWFDGLSYEDIARELHVSVKSVDNSLARAMRLLRDVLKAEPER